MEKKTTKRQTTIITLSDHNKQEIRNIQLQKEIMEEEFDEKEKGDLTTFFVKEFIIADFIPCNIYFYSTYCLPVKHML